MKAMNRRLMRIEGYMGFGAEGMAPIFFTVVDTSVPDPDTVEMWALVSSDSLTAYEGRLNGDHRVIKRQPEESVEALQARCAKSAPHIAIWMPVHPAR